jgi:hypothetical protein
VLLRYNDEIATEPGGGKEEIEDPVSFCRERIEELRVVREGTPLERGAAAYILGFVGSRSPSAVVRAEALKALRWICRDEAVSFRFSEPNVVDEEWKASCEAWLTLMGPDRAEADSPSSATTRAAELLAYFGSLNGDSAWRAWETLAFLTVRSGHTELGSAVAEEMEEIIRRLMGQTFYLTVVEGIFDSSSLVVHEAVDGLFLFRPEDIRVPLALLVERCYDSPLRIHILGKLAKSGFTPEDIGGRLMITVRDSLDFSDPGIVFHAVKLFESLTGIENDDPGFWKSWWAEYLRDHADDLSDRSFEKKLEQIERKRD